MVKTTSMGKNILAAGQFARIIWECKCGSPTVIEGLIHSLTFSFCFFFSFLSCSSLNCKKVSWLVTIETKLLSQCLQFNRRIHVNVVFNFIFGATFLNQYKISEPVQNFWISSKFFEPVQNFLNWYQMFQPRSICRSICFLPRPICFNLGQFFST